jgi:hypothetical protein
MVKNPVAKALSSKVCRAQVIPPRRVMGAVLLVGLMPLPRGLSTKGGPSFTGPGP